MVLHTLRILAAVVLQVLDQEDAFVEAFQVLAVVVHQGEASAEELHLVVGGVHLLVGLQVDVDLKGIHMTIRD